eukprot:m.462289 g.462289  ORF g.462289 m.462289 type:complete len:167 (-) comp22576_c0_seq1:359-859(-)
MGKKKGGAKKGSKKGGAKKKGSKKKSGSKKEEAAPKEEEVEVAPLKGAWVQLAVTCSSFHKRDTLPCHFTEVFNIGTRLSEIRGQIASRYDHTVSEIVLFEGEIERGELVQTADPLDLDDTLLDIGVEPFTADEANDGDPTHTIYYDYQPPIVNCAIANTSPVEHL